MKILNRVLWPNGGTPRLGLETLLPFVAAVAYEDPSSCALRVAMSPSTQMS